MAAQNRDRRNQIAQLIDHTLLKPQAAWQDIEGLCQEALQHGFFSVCIQPKFVALAAEILKESPVKTCTVVGFPLGANLTATKVFEAGRAIEDGADELDMVMDLGSAKSGAWEQVTADIHAVVETAGDVPVKVILETCDLDDDEIARACIAAHDAGAAFVKTSTGFGSGGATTAAVQIMKNTVGASMQVKASGGIRNLADVEAMVAAGATRIGASAGVAIMAELNGST